MELTTLDGQAPEIYLKRQAYIQNLEEFLRDHGYQYSRMNPLEDNLQMASMRRHKTDKSDAHELAKTHFNMNRDYTYQQDEYYEQMRALTRYYGEVDTEMNHLRNRMHAILQLSFPELEKLITPKSALFLNIVQLYPHPAILLTHSKTIIKNRLKENTRKNLSLKRAEEKAIVLLEAAKESYPAISPMDIRCEQVKDYAKRIAELKEKKEQLVKQMVELSEGGTEYKILRSFPGIGDATAVRIIGELGDIRRFKNNKQLNAYVGIDIMTYQSGNTRYQDRINKRGNKKLRKILFFMLKAMITLRQITSNHLVDYYDKLKTQPHRKPHKVAVIACMNKFLKLISHLIHHNLPYDYNTARPCV
ncbi:IS110 family transposase [Bacillus sp. Bva_UNVM-123]|uniref:IS110 family transposase n=1 Tax=Bacillus sp. Bva_UNVM-123 TaxID=2829798 RepID=UPI00391EF15D